ncbi:YpdA family putative bacillithiol disulfide reductase [Virgibacillus halodenitrificans]|uniref:YpdA family putative bacillithiol disulfide reductase n=1 Tax=Virgibacillus halodenitrificans TaxID=1482 RepID=UPI0024C039EB|nr:YpdA family putative bacillithiol disulfide reductase [Virgibacillus halodenitrificans]WHX27380.1 YpdA family putative bacillithiol disulfide reductase [Virgibacillus halodenitrificans]
MNREKVIIIGGGPCGMSCAIELQRKGISSLIIEKENIVNTIYNFPTHQTFFSSSEKLEIGGIPFITEKQKPVRNQALAYYRTVAERENLRIQPFEKVVSINKKNKLFEVNTEYKAGGENKYLADHVIIASGYYDQPNYMGIPGEDKAKVMHYFKEAHPYFDANVLVIGGKNSAVDATLELHKAGARVTVLYRGSEYSKSIKPWILPEFDSLVRNKKISMYFNACVTEITEEKVHYSVDDKDYSIENDYVFAMTGYHPDLSFLRQSGVEINKDNGRPNYNENTYETNIPGIYIAGVVASGYNNNEIFIENGRFHGEAIANHISLNYR